MWVRVAGSRVGYFGRLIGSGSGRSTLLCLAVSGCMTLGDKAPPAPVSNVLANDATAQPASLMLPEPVPTARPHPRKLPHEKAIEKQAAEKPVPVEKPVVVIDPDQLIGLSPEAVEKLMGAPAQVKDDHLSREWVYASADCNFRVFFYPNLNAAAFRALKYGGSDNHGGTLAASNACIRRILTARGNAAD